MLRNRLVKRKLDVCSLNPDRYDYMHWQNGLEARRKGVQSSQQPYIGAL